MSRPGVTSSPRLPSVAVAGVLVAATLAACGSGSGGDTAAAVTRTSLADPIDHVHGLALSSDGDVLAGTHSGLVRIGPDGSVTRVGDGRDDLMGMTGEPGAATLLTSGHPGPGSSRPDPVGLLRSDDGGRTWDTLSLEGEVDFHALGVSGERVVGYGGGESLLVSEDGGRTWRAGASLAAAAVVVDGDEVWATTAEGLRRSADGGSTFAAVAGAPVLVLLSRGADGSLWGVDTGGQAWVSPDGREWQGRADVGPVQGLVAVDTGLAYAVTQDSVMELR